MVFLAIELCIGAHGAGIQQWSLPYSEYQYNLRVTYIN